MRHILFVLPYPGEGASTRFRVEQYLGHLTKAGFTYALSPFFDPEGFRTMVSGGGSLRKGLEMWRGLRRRMGDLARVGEADLVFVHREAFPVGPPIFERRFLRKGARLIYDFDDAVYLPKEGSLHPRTDRLRNPGKVAEIMELSQLVIAGNRHLAEYARAHSARVVVIPTPIDTERFGPRPEGQHGEPPVIGWIGNPTGIRYLDILRPVLRRLAAKTEFRVRVIGGVWECPGVKVECRAWERSTEVADTQGFDVGVMPLPDTPWARGKCAFKLIQYMSCGVAAVASPVGMNREVVQEGENGFLATTEQEWTEKLEALVRDASLREVLGRRGRELVEEVYSVKVRAPEFIEALRAALGDTDEPSG